MLTPELAVLACIEKLANYHAMDYTSERHAFTSISMASRTLDAGQMAPSVCVVLV